MSESIPEAWLRGPLPEMHPFVAPTLFSFRQAREDLTRWTEGLTTQQIWARPHGLAPLGFQLKHIAGSVERLTTYLEDRQLSAEQLAELKQEMEGGEDLQELLGRITRVFDRSESILRVLSERDLPQPREIGRKRLPTTVIGLVVHIAEHTQRHVGEAIITAKILRP